MGDLPISLKELTEAQRIFERAADLEANAQRLRLRAVDPILITLFDIRERFKIKCSTPHCGAFLFSDDIDVSLDFIFQTWPSFWDGIQHGIQFKCSQCMSMTLTECGATQIEAGNRQGNGDLRCTRVGCRISGWWLMLAAFDNEYKAMAPRNGENTNGHLGGLGNPGRLNIPGLEDAPMRKAITLIKKLLANPADEAECHDICTMIRHSSLPYRIGNLFKGLAIETIILYQDLFASVFSLLQMIANSEHLKSILSETHIRTTSLPILGLINSRRLLLLSEGEVFNSSTSIVSHLVPLNYAASNIIRNLQQAIPGTSTICDQIIATYNTMPGQKFTLRWHYTGPMKRIPLRDACSALGTSESNSNEMTCLFLQERVNKGLAQGDHFNGRHLEFGEMREEPIGNAD